MMKFSVKLFLKYLRGNGIIWVRSHSVSYLAAVPKIYLSSLQNNGFAKVVWKSIAFTEPVFLSLLTSVRYCHFIDAFGD